MFNSYTGAAREVDAVARADGELFALGFEADLGEGDAVGAADEEGDVDGVSDEDVVDRDVGRGADLDLRVSVVSIMPRHAVADREAAEEAEAGRFGELHDAVGCVVDRPVGGRGVEGEARDFFELFDRGLPGVGGVAGGAVDHGQAAEDLHADVFSGGIDLRDLAGGGEMGRVVDDEVFEGDSGAVEQVDRARRARHVLHGDVAEEFCRGRGAGDGALEGDAGFAADLDETHRVEGRDQVVGAGAEDEDVAGGAGGDGVVDRGRVVEAVVGGGTVGGDVAGDGVGGGDEAGEQRGQGERDLQAGMWVGFHGGVGESEKERDERGGRGALRVEGRSRRG
jgi:hypothetical protein